MEQGIAVSDVIPSATVARISDRLLAWLPLACIISLFAVFAFAYSVRVPVYEAPDEVAHVKYAYYIATENRLPDMSDSYEAWQPPLYYAIGGITLKVFGLRSIPQLELNPNGATQVNSDIHGTNEGFPYSEPFLAVHVLRWMTILFGAAALVFVYLISLTVLPERKLLALASAATAGLVPQFTFTSGYVSNDVPAMLFATVTIYFGLRLLREPRFKWAAAAAAALTLGGLTKSSVAAVACVPLLTCIFAPLSLREKAKLLAMIAGLPAAIAGPFYLRNIIQWGAIYPAHLLWSTSPRPIWDPVYRGVFWSTLRDSYWYLGGGLNIPLSPILYDVLNVAGVLAVGGVIVAFVSRKLSQFQQTSLLLLALTIVCAFLGILYYCVFLDFQPQGRYLFAAQAAFAMLFTFGIGALFSRDPQREHPAVLVMPVMLALLNISILLINLPNAY